MKSSCWWHELFLLKVSSFVINDSFNSYLCFGLSRFASSMLSLYWSNIGACAIVFIIEFLNLGETFSFYKLRWNPLGQVTMDWTTLVSTINDDVRNWSSWSSQTLFGFVLWSSEVLILDTYTTGKNISNYNQSTGTAMEHLIELVQGITFKNSVKEVAPHSELPMGGANWWCEAFVAEDIAIYGTSLEDDQDWLNRGTLTGCFLGNRQKGQIRGSCGSRTKSGSSCAVLLCRFGTSSGAGGTGGSLDVCLRVAGANRSGLNRVSFCNHHSPKRRP